MRVSYTSNLLWGTSLLVVAIVCCTPGSVTQSSQGTRYEPREFAYDFREQDMGLLGMPESQIIHGLKWSLNVQVLTRVCHHSFG
jgi:hypothetical protein